MGSLFIGVLELLCGIACAFQQIATTHDSVVSALQGGILVTTKMKPEDVLVIINQSADKFNRIGWFVAICTQLMFLSTVLPSQHKGNTLRTILLWGFGIMELTTDIWYSLATSTTLGGAFTFIFTCGWSGLGASLLYVIAMSAGSIFILTDGISRVESGIAKLRSASSASSASRAMPSRAS